MNGAPKPTSTQPKEKKEFPYRKRTCSETAKEPFGLAYTNG